MILGTPDPAEAGLDWHSQRSPTRLEAPWDYLQDKRTVRVTNAADTARRGDEYSRELM